jgi:trigger factor
MQVTIDEINNISRKLSIEIPEERLLSLQEKKFKKLANSVKIDGFRKGKVPLALVKQRYGADVQSESMGDLIRDTLYEALLQHKINPVGMPTISDTEYTHGQPVKFVAQVEIYPTVVIKPFSDLDIEQLQAEVTDEDVENTVEKILEQHKEWEQKEGGCEQGDRVIIDFTGSVDGESFEAGTAKDFSLELGQGRMIPGFDEGIYGMVANETKTIDVTFPEDYQTTELAGKQAQFDITLNKVEHATLPNLDDDFAKKLLNKDDATVDSLRAEVRQNLQRELDNALESDIKNKVFDAFNNANHVDVPKAMIDSEIQQLQQQMSRYMNGMQQSNELFNNSAIFEDEANKRVSLGLLVAEVVKQHELKVEPTAVREKIESIAEVYEQPQELIDMYYKDKDRLQSMEQLVMEQMIVDKILAEAKVTYKSVSFEEVMGKKLSSR